MFIRECMTKNPVTIEPGDTLARADAKMKAGGFRRLPVVLKGELIGIVSEYDLRRYPDFLESTLVLVAMTPDPVTVSPSATLEHAVALLKGNEIGALPVVDHGRLVGIITASNLWFPEPRPLPEWEKRS
ncbi:MAG TPA: CBS domain-containing protein [Candidatus Binatus sp.]|jgi:acetoin utilization protein AcuB|uniref:CBS domain-containing protein n=1 Tax=Candidatus Binatus sp. TaxID=2811406 RepID=UPI002F3FCD31